LHRNRFFLSTVLSVLLCASSVRPVDSAASNWVQNYGGANYDEAYSLVQTSDEGYALAGYTDSFGAGDHDFWLVKTDENGVAPNGSGQVPFPTEIIYAVTAVIITLIVAIILIMLKKNRKRLGVCHCRIR